MKVLGVVSVLVFWLGALWLLYVYWGYGQVLRLLAWRSRNGSATACPGQDRRVPPPHVAGQKPGLTSVSVLLTVHNEEGVIERRLRNLLAQDYPPEHMDIVVASDGSSDRTERIVEDLARGWPIRLVRTERLGKSGAQNWAMRSITSEIVVFTDAGAVFDGSCVTAMVAEFDDPAVGCVTAELHHSDAEGAIGQSQSRYWSYELRLRLLESQLRNLAVASGAAMAVRRSLFRDLPAFVGDDCIIPLDVVSQDHRVVHCAAARAWDRMASEESSELRARIRMTMRNWSGTWRYPVMLNPLRQPGYAFALWSHKLLRWLGAFALVAMILAAAGMVVAGYQRPVAVAFALFLVAGLAGWAGNAAGRALPICGTVYAFLLAHLGFLLGVSKAMFGRRLYAYPSGRS
jgi:cellulose synthase/poly-beta-1,6-N-acetylglucosamine synthase-like glycosyltransferase